jgi:superfamily II DNA or RNA helicase
MKPFPDQEKSINAVLQKFENQQRLLFQLPTGGGKTAIFSFICKRWKHGKVLVLAHRDELINQTLHTLRTIGVSCESVIASKKRLHHHCDVYVAMIQTLKNRLKNDDNFLRDVSLIIIDECHLLMHEEIFAYYPNAKILGVTATPTVLKKVNFTICHKCKTEHPNVTQCCGFETYEYSRKFTLSEIYEDIICGQQIGDLIENGRLVRELVYSTGSVNRSKFTIDAKTGDYDTKSTDEYYTHHSMDVVKSYEQNAKDKKTIIFNSSSKANAIVLQSFLDAGYENVKLFDSVNETENRKKVLQWFKETPNAILLNVNCFTTGFDEPTLECVILNRATKSLSLYHQMVGRGGRVCNEIYKPYFILIDGGGNVDEFGKWSDYIDWTKHFYNTEKPRPKKEALEDIKICTNCGVIHAKNATECPSCSYSQPKTEIKQGTKVATLVDEYPLPDGRKIIEYCKKIGKDKNFAWTILINQIVDLFIYHRVEQQRYNNTVYNGNFEKRMREIIKLPYLQIQNSELEGGVMRTKAWIIKKINDKLNKIYENQTRK